MKGLGQRAGSLHVRDTSVNSFTGQSFLTAEQGLSSGGNPSPEQSTTPPTNLHEDTIQVPQTEVVFSKSILSNRSSGNSHMITMHENREIEFDGNNTTQRSHQSHHQAWNLYGSPRNHPNYTNRSVQSQHSQHSMPSQPSLIATRQRSNSYLFNKDAKRWDLLFLAYMFSIFSTSAAFGASHNSQYNHIIFFFVFIHFAAETVISWNFIFSTKV